jgi:hypothetical protein
MGAPLTWGVYRLLGRADFINDPRTGRGIGHALGTVVIYVILLAVLVPVAVFVAHWCEVLIDGPSTRFARWADDWFARGVSTEQGDEDAEKGEERETPRILEVEQGASNEEEQDHQHSESAPLLVSRGGSLEMVETPVHQLI